MHERYAAFLLSVGLLLAGCDLGSGPSRDGPRFFRFLHTSDSTTFVAATADDDVVEEVEQQLDRRFEARGRFIIGPIARGNGGHNGEYPWHFEEGEWELTETAVEGCDGTPTYVSENVDYFVDDVGRYCPWSARVLEEVSAPDDRSTLQ